MSYIPLVPRVVNAQVLLRYCSSPAIVNGYEALCNHVQTESLKRGSMSYESVGDHLIFHHTFANAPHDMASRLPITEMWVVTRPLAEIDRDLKSDEVEASHGPLQAG